MLLSQKRVLAIALLLAAINAFAASDKHQKPVTRWQNGDAQSSLVKTPDGLYHYGLEYETLKVTMTLDPEELQKTKRTLSHVLRILLTFQNRGNVPIDIGPEGISLEFVDHEHVLMSALDPDDFSYRIQDDSDELIHQSERELQKHPERKALIESKLREHEKVVSEWLEYLSTRALQDVQLNTGQPEVTGMVFFRTKTKWKGDWKKEENFVLRVPALKRVFEFPFTLPPHGEGPTLRERPES
jgi:hypothetical protein